MPTPERGVSAAILRCAGRSILFDCGEGTQVALRREKISPIKIDLIALTHYHGDHIFGLPGLLQTMDCLKRTEPLYITGPDGLEDAMEPILKLVVQTAYEVRLVKTDSVFGVAMKTFNSSWPDGARLHPFATEHRVLSQGYSFMLSRASKFLPEKAKELGIPVHMWKQIIASDPDTPIQINGEVLSVGGTIIRGHHLMGETRRGLRVVISGDTQPCKTLEGHAYGADLLISDATYGEDAQADEAELWGHSTFRQAAELARDACVRQLWLTHFSQSMKAPADYLANALSVFPNSVCGYDGLSVTLQFDDE